jgi:hypothetical protein
MAFLAFLLIYFRVMPPLWVFPLGILAAALAFLTFRTGWDGKFYAASATALMTALIIYTAAYRMVMPAVEQLWLSRQTANVIVALRPCLDGPAVLTRYREPSAIFLLGTETKIESSENALKALLSGTASYGMFESTELEKLPLGTDRLTPLACLNGFNVNVGKHLQMQILSAQPEETFAGCPVPAKYRCAR